jgi:hypothetical protein
MPSATDSQTSDQLLLKANPKLSQGDIQTYHIKKRQLFKFTVAICAIYGVIAFILLMITLFTPQGSLLFTQEIRPFTITFIGGIIFVIILLIIQIMSFKPMALTMSAYDKDICPDFWKLTPTPNNDPSLTAADAATKGLYQYQCKPDTSVYTTYTESTSGSGVNAYGQTIVGPLANPTSTTKQLTLPANLAATDPKKKLSNLIGTGTNKATLQCDQVFPNYLANQNAVDTDIQDTPNALASAWADACGVPWSNVVGK